MLYGIKDSANFRVDSKTTNKPILFCDYAKLTNIDFTADSVYAYNKSTKAIRWDSEREGTFRTELEVFEKKWISLLFGSSESTSAKDISHVEVIEVNAGGAAATDLAKVPKANSIFCFITTDKEHGVEQTEGNPATTENEFSVSGQTLTFNATTFSSAGKVIVYYLENKSVTNFTVDNVSFPGGYTIYADGAIRDTDQNDTYVQYQLLNVKPKSNVSLTMDADNVTRLVIEWDIFADSEGNMMHYIEV